MKKSTMSIIFGLFFIGALLAEGYCLLEFRSNPIAIIGPGVIALISGFFCFDGIVSVFESQQEERQKLLKEQFNIQNMLEQEQFEHIKQMTHLMETQQELLEQLTDDILDEIMSLVGESAKLQIRHNAKNIKIMAEGQKTQLDSILEEIRTLKTSEAISPDELKKLERTITAGTEKISVSVDRGVKSLKAQLADLSFVTGGSIENKGISEEKGKFNRSADVAEDVFAAEDNFKGNVELTDLPEEEIPEDISSEEIPVPDIKGSEEEPEVAAEPKAEPAPTVTPPSDDPNHVMTPEEIAAMIAGVGEEEPAEEPVAAEPKPKAEPKPVVTPPSDDPNHVMTPEEIAAMIAGVGAEEPAAAEPKAEPEPVVTPPSDDPNHVMTPEEIAAMIAGMGAEEPAAAEPKAEPTPVVTPPSDDPNHVMTPEEIAAMFAGAGAEEPAAAEPKAEPTPVVTPPSDDPNHVMTPEEIAAMIAGMS